MQGWRDRPWTLVTSSSKETIALTYSLPLPVLPGSGVVIGEGADCTALCWVLHASPPRPQRGAVTRFRSQSPPTFTPLGFGNSDAL